MSLTKAIDDPRSIYRQWIATHMHIGNAEKLRLHINNWMTFRPIIVNTHNDLSTAGTAFDYGFRWYCRDLDMLGTAAGRVLKTVSPVKVESLVEMCRTMNHWRNHDYEAFMHNLPVACVALAWCEHMGRNNSTQGFSSFLQVLPTKDPLKYIAEIIEEPIIIDLDRLFGSIPEVWHDMTSDKLKTFRCDIPIKGGSLIGGATADWIIDGELYECKTTLGSSFKGAWLLQMLGYVLLDYANEENIKLAGWYFSRQKMRVTYTVDELCSGLFYGKPIAELRESLCSALLEDRLDRLKEKIDQWKKDQANRTKNEPTGIFKYM